LHLPEETQGLVLLECGAELPCWLEVPGLALLEQQSGESCEDFGVRANARLKLSPTATHVVVVLSATSHLSEERTLSVLGGKFVRILATRPHPRMLLCVPPETPERKRKELLAVASALAKEEGASSCVPVGAHFSARPPPSETLPALHAVKVRQ
jgi:hypothetical protein